MNKYLLTETKLRKVLLDAFIHGTEVEAGATNKSFEFWVKEKLNELPPEAIQPQLEDQFVYMPVKAVHGQRIPDDWIDYRHKRSGYWLQPVPLSSLLPKTIIEPASNPHFKEAIKQIDMMRIRYANSEWIDKMLYDIQMLIFKGMDYVASDKSVSEVHCVTPLYVQNNIEQL